MQKMGEKLFSVVMGMLVLGVMLYLAKDMSVFTTSENVKEQSAETENSRNTEEKENGTEGIQGTVCVVLDAGHGGFDPGKVGVTGQKEAEINLAITLKVRNYLEANGVKVVMTRETAEGLYDEGENNKKVQDMKRRIAIMEEAAPVAAVSIHQNSYPEEYVNGAQVFYHEESREGEALAALLQEALREYLNPQNHRQKKSNDSYYLLKKTSIPTVIVECGFLSNYKEAALLESEEYQDRVAWAIHIGILQFINKN